MELAREETTFLSCSEMSPSLFKARCSSFRLISSPQFFKAAMVGTVNWVASHFINSSSSSSMMTSALTAAALRSDRL